MNTKKEKHLEENKALLKDTSGAICEILKFSTDAQGSVEIHGGYQLAFLAALSHWLLDLKIWVDNEDESLLFSDTCSMVSEAQVYLKYRRGNDRSLGDSPVKLTRIYIDNKRWVGYDSEDETCSEESSPDGASEVSVPLDEEVVE